MQDALIVLGVGISQVPLLKAAKLTGLAIIGVDRDLKSKGRLLCDEMLNVSTHNSSDIMNLLEPFENQYRFVGVLTRSNGIPTLTRAYIADKYNLPGPNVTASVTAASKIKMITLAHKCGIKAPRQYNKINELNNDNFPLVVKPEITISGKKGIYFINTVEQLNSVIEESRHYSDSGEVEVEQFIEGDDYLLINFVQRGKLIPWLALKEHVANSENNEVTGVGFSYFPVCTESKKLIESSKDLAKCLDVSDGVLISAYRVSNNGDANLIETHLDIGGDLILDELVPMISKDNPFVQMVNCFVGQKICLSSLDDVYATVMYLFDNDKLDEKVLRQLEKVKSVNKVLVDFNKSGRIGHISICSKEEKEYMNDITKVQRLLNRPEHMEIA